MPRIRSQDLGPTSPAAWDLKTGCPQGAGMARVVRLRTRREQEARDKAAELGRQLSFFPEEALTASGRLARSKLLNDLSRFANPDDAEGLWPGGFTMISRKQTKAVWDAIRALPAED